MFWKILVLLLSSLSRLSSGEEETDESNNRYKIEGKVVIQGEKHAGIYFLNGVFFNVYVQFERCL